MKKQIIYIGGGEAKENYKDFKEYLEKLEFNPYEEKVNRWSKYLNKDLGEEFEVINIPMPNKHFADYDEWKIMFEKVFPYLKKGVSFLGHSLGATFLIKYLNEGNIDCIPENIFLLAPAFEDSGGEVLGTFNFSKDLDRFDEKFGEKTTLFHSHDDFVVPFTDFLSFKNNLQNARFIEFEDKNHFLDEEFNELLEIIKNTY